MKRDILIIVTLQRYKIIRPTTITIALKYRPLKESSDFEVIELIAKQESQAAKTEFYYRYRSFLLQVCRQACRHFEDGEHLAHDIFQNTIIKALKGINSLFKKYSIKSTTGSSYIKAWLSVIAKNELIEFLRKNPDEKRLGSPFRISSDEIEITDEIANEGDDDFHKPSIEKEKLDKALSTLSVRDMEVLMTYLVYQSQHGANTHLPNDVIANLSKKYNVNGSDHLRQIKRRAILKLKKACKMETNEKKL